MTRRYDHPAYPARRTSRPARCMIVVLRSFCCADAAVVAMEAVQRLSQEVELLTSKRRNLRRRCFEFFMELSEARARIAELESVVSAQKYTLKCVMKPTTIDLERCAPCATEEEEHLKFSDA